MTPDRLDELRTDQLTEALSALERAELAALEREFGTWDDRAATAAAMQLSLLPNQLEPLNDSLAKKLLADAKVHLPRSVVVPSTNLNHSAMWSGWAVAAGVMVVVGSIWLANPKPIPTVAKLKTPQEIRTELLAKKADRFESTKVAAKPSGEVLWDRATQSGIMSLTGLKPNNPSQKQYQLWIVDAGRTHAEPVDGGVFDVDADGRAIVPVRAALAIRDAKLFAVTEEPPGGVVVSERGKRGEFVVVMAK